MLFIVSAADITESHATRRAGRVSKANLPQEYELAQLVQNIENPHPSWNASTPACEWDGVDCDVASEIKSIKWNVYSGKSYQELTGSLSFVYLPKTVRIFDVFLTKLSGEVPLNTLPFKLESMNLRNNDLSGPLDLTALPPIFNKLVLSGNRFTGEICLDKLPSGLKYLWLDCNQLSGKVCLCNLPSALYLLDLSSNVNLHGEVEKRLLRDMAGLNLKIRNTSITRVGP